jgi:hypothetical protein
MSAEPVPSGPPTSGGGRAGAGLVAVLALVFALAAGAAPVVIAVRLIGAGASAILPVWGR